MVNSWSCKIFTLLLCLLKFENGSSHMVGNNPLHQKEQLDPDGKFHLEWITDSTTKTINFTVTVETLGFVLFGLSKNGTLTGADFIIGGVRNRQSYFSDRYGISEQQTALDSSQDWTLHSARENGSHTILSFSRRYDSCDSQDYPITDDKITLIWGYGSSDDENGVQRQNQGVANAYLLTPSYLPEVTRDEAGKVTSVVGDTSLADLKSWTLTTKMVMPTDTTTYWCTIQSAISLSQKQHIVGFDTRFGSEEQRKHVHHVDIRRCQAPPGTSTREMFEPFVNHPGQSCPLFNEPSGPIQTQHCVVFWWTWAIGGKTFFLPPHIGIPLNPAEDEYYLIQVHYDNPNGISNLAIESHVDFHYTSNLRERDGGLLVFGSPFPGLPPNILIPPQTTDHQLFSHCGAHCTRKMFPETGIKVTAGLLHTHNAGYAIRLQHFRESREQPTILFDNNYDNTYQQFRTLREEVTLLPGDHITSQCVYDSTRMNNGTVVGGLSTKQEMCFLIIIYHDQLLEFGECLSEIISDEVREHFLGVTNITWSDARMEYVVQPPDELAGLTIKEVSDFHVDWTPERREDFAKVTRSYPQVNTCPRISTDPAVVDDDSSLETYPEDATPYQEEATCPINKPIKNTPIMYSIPIQTGFNGIRHRGNRRNQFGWKN